MDDDKLLTIHEFKLLMISFSEEPDTVFWWAFNMFDTNRDGFISVDEMKEILPWAPDQNFNILGTEKRLINFEEFKQYVREGH